MPDSILRQNQIIVAALAVVSALVLGVGLFLRATNDSFDGEGLVISILALTVSFGGGVARTVVMGVLVSQGRSRIRGKTFTMPQAAAGSAWAELDDDTRGLVSLFQAKTIIGAALVERAFYSRAVDLAEPPA